MSERIINTSAPIAFPSSDQVAYHNRRYHELDEPEITTATSICSSASSVRSRRQS